ncbi:MAG: hypothetical protein PHT19_07415, partial [Methylococcus sp.]|nr:hypothetical protein [Methylococcus sp.]
DVAGLAAIFWRCGRLHGRASFVAFGFVMVLTCAHVVNTITKGLREVVPACVTTAEGAGAGIVDALITS